MSANGPDRPRLDALEGGLLRRAGLADCALVPGGEDGGSAGSGAQGDGAQGGTDGGAALTAYLVPSDDQDPAALRRRAAAHLLEEAPGAVIRLVDGIPRTADGRPDAAALAGASDPRERPRPARRHLGELSRHWRPFAAAPAPAPGPAPQSGPGAVGVGAEGGGGAGGEPAVAAGPAPASPPEGPADLPDALLRAARLHPERGLHLVRADGTTTTLRYPELLDRALRVLATLTEAGLRPGDRAILQVPDLEHYFPALWACLLGGLLPVTVARPPGYDHPNPVLEKLVNAWETLEHPPVLAAGDAVAGLADIAALHPRAAGLRVVPVDRSARTPPAAPHGASGDVAFLQLSSGSTGRSKAIRISHRGILEYVAGAREHGYDPGDATVNWLPLDHVAGLLMFHLRDVVAACDQTHIPTELVLADPLLWLDTLERQGAAHSWSPNFGYRLVAEALRAAPGRRWDLSRVKSLINAGEQCTESVADEFLARLAPCGLRPEHLLLGWGMAETCTIITYKRYGEAGAVQLLATDSLTGDLRPAEPDAAEPVTRFLSMGRPAAGARLRVADDHGTVLPELRIGRLQVSSGRVTPGYLNNPQADRESATADGWFDTGDLAYLRDGEVVLTGRRKEIIIINGVHHFCHDLEDVVSAVDGVLSGHVAACGVPDERSGSEQLAVFLVPAPGAGEPHELAGAVRGALAGRFALSAALVLPVPAADFPRTTSGKIQRTAIRERLLAGDFDESIARLDLAEGNARTVPDIVRTPAWEPRPAPSGPAPVPQEAVLLVGPTGPGTLSDALAAVLPRAVQAGQGEAFARAGAGYLLDQRRAEGWPELLEHLEEGGLRPRRVLHLWAQDGEPDPVLCGEALLGLARALAHRYGSGAQGVELTTVSAGLHALADGELPRPAAALSAALSGSVRAEQLLGAARHLDLPAGAAAKEGASADEEAVQAVLAFLADPRREPEAAWRGGRAYVPRLGPLPAPADGPSCTLLSPGARWLVTGALGGIAGELLPELLRRHGLRLLLVGRGGLAGDGPGAARRRGALERLARAGGQVDYRTADVTDRQAPAAVVAEAERAWGAPLQGVLHLAGDYRIGLLEELGGPQWREAVRAKTEGTDALAELVRARPGAQFVGFSSMIGFQEVVGSAGYAAANRYLEAAAERLRREHRVPAWTVSWGLWSGVGMNRETSHDEGAAERGIAVFDAAQGRRLAAALLSAAPGHYYAGPDTARPAARRRLLAGEPRLIDEQRPAREARADGGPRTDGAAPPVAGPAAGELRRAVLDAFEAVLGESVDPGRAFHELGLGSVQLMRVHAALAAGPAPGLAQTALFRHPTVDALAAHLAGDPQEPVRPAAPGTGHEAAADRRVAVIGLALRLPGADTPEQYWRNIVDGVVSTTRYTPGQLAAAGIRAEEYTHPDFVPVTAPIADIGHFDAEAFGISAAEAALMDPQQRLLLETCARALDEGGYGDSPPDTRIGVFAGTGMTLYSLRTYLQQAVGAAADPARPVEALQVAIGNQADFAATRVAYRLGLTGPAVGVQTACSTSLVAVHLAVQSLLTGDSDLALAGAAALHVPQAAGYRYQEGSILAPDGVCRAFDERAGGTVGGNGVAAVLLKRLDRALADGDTVHAVILGSAVNNDGAGKVGYTAPSVDGQAAVVGRALDVAGVAADSIGYIEAHGTGTPLGDPIEVQALTRAFRARTEAVGFCALGSVKPNIGHLDTCAGLAGLIKAVLALRHGTIPPLANLTRPNPALGLAGSPFVLSSAGAPWPAGPAPRRAGVSALGVGGTNAHLVLEEAPAPRAPEAAGAPEPGLLPLSARSPEALAELAGAVAGRLRADPPPRPGDLLLTLGAGRRALRHRLAATGTGAGELAEALEAFRAEQASGPAHTSRDAGRSVQAPVLLYTGQGAQYRGMAGELYGAYPVFRGVLDTCERLHREAWGESLLELLLEPEGTGGGGGREVWSTEAVQPALFAVQAAYTALWEEFGVRPAAVAGHSAGEYAAAYAAGAFSLADGLFLAGVRGRLMHRSTEPGAMTAVAASAGRLAGLEQWLPGVDLAVVNGAGQCVLAGRPKDVAAAEAVLALEGLSTDRLAGDRAFHSRLMDPVLEAWRGRLEEIAFRPLRVPLVTNLGGAVLAAGTVPQAGHFVRQTREAARFDQVLAALDGLGHGLFLEVGPHHTLSVLGRRELAQAVFVASGRRGRSPERQLLGALGALWTHGAGVDWAAVAAARTRPEGPARRVPLPGRPLHRTYHWFTAPGAPPAPEAVAVAAPVSGPEAVPATAPTAVPEADRTVLEETVMTDTPAPEPAQQAAGLVLRRVVEQTARQLGVAEEAVGAQDPFFDLGADSLSMINMIRDLERAFRVRVSMRELFEDADTPARLAGLIVERMDAQALAALVPAPEPVSEPAPQPAPEPAVAAAAAVPVAVAPAAAVPEAAVLPAAAVPSSVVPAAVPPVPAPVLPAAGAPSGAALPGSVIPGEAGAVIDRQLALLGQFSELMAHQLDLLAGSAPGAPAAPALPAAAQPAAVPVQPAPAPVEPAVVPPAAAPASAAPQVHGPRVSVARDSGMAAGGLSGEQRRHLDDLVGRFTARTAASKALTQRHRRVLADSRAVVGFRSATKEMLYPIAARGAHGSRLEDIDGNSYVDITMGFGVLLFGHEPEFVREAVREHLGGGLRLGPRGEETGEAAELLAELTGTERVAFANSGTEANAGAIRLARAHTGRDKIVMFEGSYHGHFDHTLGRPVGHGADRETVPVSIGIPGSAVADLIVLQYGDPQSLRVIDELGDRIAAVLVEPVQSRHPSRQPAEFVRELRELTARRGIVLVFDEMLTGFRPHLRGARGFWGVEPDLSTYGKVLGGGFPIGAIAGRAAVMDGIDGGFWQYGDGSYPPNDTTFFGGTYIQHPLSMAACRAVLRHFKEQGPGLQERLNARTGELAATLNGFFAEEEFPLSLAHFGSLFRFEPRADMELLFHHLLVKGVYVWEWRNFFLSTAHSDGDVEFVIDAVRDSLRDMRRGGFLPATRAIPAHAIPAPAVPAPRRELPGPGAEVRTAAAAAQPQPAPPAPPGDPDRKVDFSLYFFGDYPLETAPEDRYRIVLESARFADRNGFHSLWLPERHFHSFGGIFPNPSVLAAALARETTRIRLNAGCAVLPLHHPVRVAEEWSVVDNLSGGRVGLGCASGWHPNDFLFFPDRYGTHKQLMHQQVDTIRALWRGEPYRGRSGSGEPIEVHLHPRPLQEAVPMFTAIVGNPDSFREAARHDLGVITNLMTQSVEELAANIALYRRTRAEHGLDPEAGRVVVLVHTYLGADLAAARAQAYRPFCSYLRSSLSLFGQVANSLGLTLDYENTPEEDLEFVLERAYERYCASRALIGTPDSVGEVLDSLRAAGADEIAAFVDFGLAPDLVAAGLPHLDELRRASALPRERRAPLSYAQQRMWFLHRMLPDSSRYNEVKAIALDGPLDAGALAGALHALAERHPALRTVFREQDGEPYQVVLPAAAAGLAVEDAPVGRDPQEAVRALVAEEGAYRFDLAAGPLLRTRLLRLGEERHVLVLSMHHIVIDTLSAVVVTRELGELYRAALAGRRADLPALPTSYARFAARERELVEQGAHAQDLEHWRKVLGGQLPVLALPTDRPRPALPDGRGRAFVRLLDGELSAGVRELARSRRSTLFMVLLTAFAGVLHRFSGQDEIVLGTPVANRDEGCEDLVGFFVNTLALRLDLSGEPDFERLLARVRATALDAFEHQRLPFEVLVQELNPQRDTSRNPLFQVLVEFENHALFELDLPGVQARPLDDVVDKAGFDLTLFLTNLPEGIRCHVEYATALFDRESVERLLAAFERLLAAAVADPARPMAELLPGAGEIATPAAAATPTPRERLARTAADHPERTAVLAPDGTPVTYRELAERAGQLAARLAAAGVRAATPVATLLPRGADQVAALLAVLHLGAVHVPVDPVHGAERCRLIAADSGAPVLLTSAATDRLGITLPAVLTDDTGGSGDTGDTDGPTPVPPAVDPDPETPAYCLYTSGTTGRPKGVLMPYRGLHALVDWNTDQHPPARTLQYASCGFDVSVQEVLTTLAGGGTLVLVDEETRYDARALAEHIRRTRTERLHLPHTTLTGLLDALAQAPVPDLREIVSGGEQLLLTPALRDFLRRHPQCRLFNHYGPTETHAVTAVELSADGPDHAPIGRPVPGSRIQLLDGAGRPVPDGAAGEIHILGAQVALGYLGRPEESAAVFAPTPHGLRYRTGDLGRLRPDGTLDYLGRIDEQVKIRGYRIEPGEVESVLRTVPGVRGAAVAAQSGPQGTALAAYAVLAEGTGLAQVRDELADRLPEHMVPRLWARVEHVPLTRNGKLDRGALPPAASLGAGCDTAPATELEHLLQRLWAQELAVAAPGVESSFFDLGGHSLAATRLLNRVREEAGLEIGVLDFFRRPTIRGMAERAGAAAPARAQAYERGEL
ncbi:MupA/Atu3671 family FMN-dependent luciferase-like monooxygenase [Kitasatospora sp. NPDC058170]|uniref:MupA/Atu3671 family FMN-dependent luciferase-like monooxygenase n=1 Tax=Kitasatospora sp. NPDC058170 TaxID=3346364 RepID=UPI0036DCB81B